MPILDRTLLTPSGKLHLLVKTTSYQAHDKITSLASDFSISRKAVYAARDAIQRALHALVHDKDAPDCIYISVDKSQLRRFIHYICQFYPRNSRADTYYLPRLP